MSARHPASVRRPRRRCGATRASHRRQRGYTLIEVIVAFALLAGALTLLLGTLTGATRQVRWSRDAGRAALHAQSLLDQVGVGEPLRPGEREGEFDDGRYHWSLRILPWVDPTAPADRPRSATPAQLYELRLAVTWGDAGPREQVRLRTLRLSVPAEGTPP